MATAKIQVIRRVNLPSVNDRTVIIGRTGSGKTYGGLWHLSEQPIDEMPYIIVDFKRDENIASLPFAQYVPIGKMPEQAGIYIVQPKNNTDDMQAMTDYLYNILEDGNTGLFIDEGYVLSQDEALNSILMQGRSKRIPVIMNTQRPVYVSRYAFSEASYIQVFHVLDKRDKKTIAEFTPLFHDNQNDTLPDFHSWYYEVAQDRLHHFKPVPSMSATRAKIDSKLRPLYEQKDLQRGMRVFL